MQPSPTAIIVMAAEEEGGSIAPDQEAPMKTFGTETSMIERIDRLGVGGEEGKRRQRRRADGEPLADGCGGVADRVPGCR